MHSWRRGRPKSSHGWTAAGTEARAAEVVTLHMDVDREARNVWAITIDDVAVGSVSINFAKHHRVAEIGYSVKKALWGQGVTSEAVQAVVDEAFAALPDLQRIQANIHPDNAGSIGVARKVGMVYEGTLRAYAFVHGEVADEEIYAVLRAEHNSRKGQSSSSDPV